MRRTLLWPIQVLEPPGDEYFDFILNPPNAISGVLNSPVTVWKFQGGIYPDLVSLLDGSKGGDAVTSEILNRAQVIAFELNSGSPAINNSGVPRGWESSKWIFSDENIDINVDFDELQDPIRPIEVIANGSTSLNKYSSTFDFPIPEVLAFNKKTDKSENFVISYILFELSPKINILSPKFRIKVSNWNDGEHGEGSPDVDAIGIFPCHAKNIS